MQAIRYMIDTTAGGTLMSKIKDEVYGLIEEITPNDYQWSNDRG